MLVPGNVVPLDMYASCNLHPLQHALTIFGKWGFKLPSYKAAD